MRDEVCPQCGVKRAQFENILEQRCDGCGQWICPSCFDKLEVVYTPNKTQYGIVGYLKLCDKCRRSYRNIPIEEHPFIG